MNTIITRLAWKNIWRNKVRSGVILGAIALGLFSGTYIDAFMNGWIVGTVNRDVDTHLAHIQIHDTAFLANADINAFFLRPAVSEKIEASGLPVSVSYRLILQGMLASANNAVGVTVKGVFPEEEKAVSSIGKEIPDTLGVFFPDNARTPVVVSKKIAEKLKVKLKSKIVFTFQDVRGEMQSLAFRVCGIYKTTNGAFDEGTIFVRYDDIFPYTGLPESAVHEAGIKTADLEACETIAPQLKNLFPGMSVRDWIEINPMLSMLLAWMDFFGIIIIGIFLLALSFGIINTMLMAVLERTRELGMLGAIGMTKGRLFRMIMQETVFLTVLGSLVGIALAALVILPSMKSGIDLSFLMEDQFEDYGFGSVVYPVMNVALFAEIVAMVVLAGILSAIYPAMKALKLKPLEAIRE
ncbi:MAG: FtsX-like permease family protein [Dysgonamonadaceae bacterium]|jgi:ABC-type lipoprotein release transport system permease subunit|nr:FtsX-like permease family protein [Dysgonamonadaceae bacterium]